jgi:hypothetical protein
MTMPKNDMETPMGADQELRALTDDRSALAARYLAPLQQLLELSSDFDELLRDCEQFDRKAWMERAARIRCVLTEEKARLGLVDRAVKNLLQCVGGSRELVRRANLRKQGQLTDSDLLKFLRRREMQRFAVVALLKDYTYGIDISHFNLSDEEKSLVTRYFRSDRRESNDSPGAVIPSAVSPALALSRALSEREPDVAAVQSALEGVSREILRRVTCSSPSLEERIRRERKGRRPHCREEENRIRVVSALESERVRLVERACAGIVRCFGGQQRLALDATWRQAEERESFEDHPLKKIIDRIVEGVETRAALEKERSQQDQGCSAASLHPE